MSQRKNELEQYVASKIKEIDPTARPTKASGASTEIGDILSSSFYCECKLRNTKNVTIDKRVWVHFLASLANPDKYALYVLQNKDGDRFVVMECDEFFELAKKAILGGN